MDDENDMFVLIVGNNIETSEPSPGVHLIDYDFEMKDIDVNYIDESSSTSVVNEESPDILVIKEELPEILVIKEELPEILNIKEESYQYKYDIALNELSETNQEKIDESSKDFCLYSDEFDEEQKDLLDLDDFHDQDLNCNKFLKSSQDTHRKIKINDHYRKSGKKFKRPLSEHQSFVNELRIQYPELAEDEELLVSTLANIMKDIKVPPPPDDYCVRNGIKLECTYCGKSTHTTWKAQRHYQENHGERYLSCFACGTDFKSATCLYKHEKRCLNEDAVIVLKARAQIIGDRGRNRPFLDEEKRLEEKKQAAAARCNGSSRQMWMCSECPAEFSSKASLNSHTLLHRGLRPHRCDVCTAAYTTKHKLKRHMQVHSPENYVCDICQKEFKLKVCLVTHLDTHLPEKKHMCIECGQRYTKKIDLNTHIATKHRNLPNPYACQVCPKSFIRIAALKYHMKHKHGMTIITRRALLNKLPSLSETELMKSELIIKSGIVVKNTKAGKQIVTQPSLGLVEDLDAHR